MKISPEFYQQGLSLYDSGATLLELHATVDAVDAQEQAALEAAGGVPHELIRNRYRDAEPSLTMGFADGVLRDLRNVLGRRGQRA